MKQKGRAAKVGMGVVGLLVVLCPMPPDAQGAPKPAALKTWDVAGSLGWFRADVGFMDCEGTHKHYGHSLYSGLILGHYWTERVKTEIALARTSEVEEWGQFCPTIPDLPGAWSGGGDIYTYHSNLKLAVSQSYQFFHNVWFHPFLGGGVVVARETERSHIPSQSVALYEGLRWVGSIDIVERTTTHTAVKTRVFGLAGFKFYLSRQAFFRTDLMIAGHTGIDQFTWRFAFGADF